MSQATTDTDQLMMLDFQPHNCLDMESLTTMDSHSHMNSPLSYVGLSILTNVLTWTLSLTLS